MLVDWDRIEENQGMVTKLFTQVCKIGRIRSQKSKLPTYKICTPLVTSLSVSKEFAWLPDPKFQNYSKDHYKAFADVYGQDVSKKLIDLNQIKANMRQLSPNAFTKENVRDAVEFMTCRKSRCIYVEKEAYTTYTVPNLRDVNSN